MTLIPAAHTPFRSDGSLAVEVVPAQAAFLAAQGLTTVFITGSTGEGHSLTSDERAAAYAAWAAAAPAHRLSVIAHVGGNSIEDVKALARRAKELGFAAISAVAPSYYRPRGVEELIDWCAAVAAEAPGVGFYYYDIPALTGVHVPVEQFLARAPARIPTLAGVKFANPDLVSYRRSLDAASDRFDLPWGVDEMLLAALATGARGAVGSSYNWAPQLYRDLAEAFVRGDYDEAGRLQSIAIAMIDAIAATGYLGTAKALMGRLGVPVGPARLPLGNPEPAQVDALMDRLAGLGFDRWGRPPVSDPADLAGFYRRALFEDCLPFWFPRMVDEVHGGFLHCLDRDGTVVDTDKSVWAQGRTSWMLLTLYLSHERRAEWLAWAESGLRFLTDHCVDPADGRMFFQVAQDGTPIRKRRYAYSESFAAIAFAAHAAATGRDESAARARHWFDRFTWWNFTPGVMPPKATGARPLDALAPRLITIVTAQELRRHLGPDGRLDDWIDRMIDQVARSFVNREHRAVLELAGSDGSISDHFDGRTLNPGHAIEAAWFILAEARHRGDDGLRALGCTMLDWMWERGWDRVFGGLFYFRDVFGRPMQEYWHDMKFWWPHDEALIATLLAYRLTRNPRYFEWHEQCRDWAFRHLGDPDHGEWFGYLHRDGTPSTTLKGSLWKSFFHHPRALWMCEALARELAAERS